MKLCTTGKVMHRSKLAADQKLQQMLSHKSTKNADLNVYLCKLCNAYHVGNDKLKYFTEKK